MVTFANELHIENASRKTSVTPSGISTTRKSPGSTPEASQLEHTTGLLLRKARTSAPGMASDTISLLFNRGLSPTTSSTELMLRFDSSAQGSHPCSCLLNSWMGMSVGTENALSAPDSCRTAIFLAMANYPFLSGLVRTPKTVCLIATQMAITPTNWLCTPNGRLVYGHGSKARTPSEHPRRISFGRPTPLVNAVLSKPAAVWLEPMALQLLETCSACAWCLVLRGSDFIALGSRHGVLWTAVRCRIFHVQHVVGDSAILSFSVRKNEMIHVNTKGN